jgi:hypothetical protein
MMIARRRSSRTKTQNLAYNLITIVAVLHHPKSDLFPTATSFLPHEPSRFLQVDNFDSYFLIQLLIKAAATKKEPENPPLRINA